MHDLRGASRRALTRDLRAPSRLAALDGVRGLSVLAVVVWHVFRALAPSAGIDSQHIAVMWWPLGTTRLGVDVFFVLSGFFVVQGAWGRTRERSASFVAAARDFFRRRALRILPAYWVSLLVLVPLVAPALLRQPKHLLLFVTVNQYVVRTLPDQVNTVLWSLTTEWHFYLLVPLVALLARRFGSWVLLGACLVTSVLWAAHGPPFGLPTGFIFGRLDQFVAGAVAAELVHRAQRGDVTRVARVLSTRFAGVAAALGVLAIGTYHGSTFGVGRGNWFDPLLHPLVGLCAAAALVSLCANSTRTSSTLASKPLRFAGLVSYSLYLWHVPILLAGFGWLGVKAPLDARDGVLIALVLACCVVVAVLSYTFVERPFLHRRRPDSPIAPGRTPVLVTRPAATAAAATR